MRFPSPNWPCGWGCPTGWTSAPFFTKNPNANYGIAGAQGARLRVVARAALHTATAVALATGFLAVVAAVRQQLAGHMNGAQLAAIVIWPLLTGVVSFLVSLVLVRILLLRQARA